MLTHIVLSLHSRQLSFHQHLKHIETEQRMVHIALSLGSLVHCNDASFFALVCTLQPFDPEGTIQASSPNCTTHYPELNVLKRKVSFYQERLPWPGTVHRLSPQKAFKQHAKRFHTFSIQSVVILGRKENYRHNCSVRISHGSARGVLSPRASTRCWC